MLTDLHKQVNGANTDEDWAKLRGMAHDVDIFVELAKMWQDESLEMAVSAYQTAVTVSLSDESEDADGEVSGGSAAATDLKAIKIGSNLGALYQLQGSAENAEVRYQEALQRIAQQSGPEAEVMKTVLAFNLGRAYEDQGEVTKATQWYRDVLRQHPEHMECEWLPLPRSERTRIFREEAEQPLQRKCGCP